MCCVLPQEDYEFVGRMHLIHWHFPQGEGMEIGEPHLLVGPGRYIYIKSDELFWLLYHYKCGLMHKQYSRYANIALSVAKYCIIYET